MSISNDVVIVCDACGEIIWFTNDEPKICPGCGRKVRTFEEARDLIDEFQGDWS